MRGWAEGKRYRRPSAFSLWMPKKSATWQESDIMPKIILPWINTNERGDPVSYEPGDFRSRPMPTPRRGEDDECEMTGWTKVKYFIIGFVVGTIATFIWALAH